jgi:hypothetical protein
LLGRPQAALSGALLSLASSTHGKLFDTLGHSVCCQVAVGQAEQLAHFRTPIFDEQTELLLGTGYTVVV